MDKSLPKLRRVVRSAAISPLKRADASSGTVTVHAVVSTSDVARDGGIIESWNLDSYGKNPVVLFSHDPQQVIGRASNLQMTAVGLEADIEFVDEATSPDGHLKGKLVAGRWMNAFSVGFSLVAERLPSDAEKAKGARWVGTGELYEISLVAVPADPNALVTSRDVQFTKNEIEMAKAQFGSIDGWTPILRSLELSLGAASVEPSLPVSITPTSPAPGTTAPSTYTFTSSSGRATRSLDDLLFEARDLLMRLQELVGELGQHGEPRSNKSDVAGTSAQQAPPAPAVVEVRSPNASASALDMHRLLEAMKRGSNSNGGKQGKGA